MNEGRDCGRDEVFAFCSLDKELRVLHSTEIVLGEMCWHLGGNNQAVHALMDLIRSQALVLAEIWPEQLVRTQEIMLKYSTGGARGHKPRKIRGRD